MKPRLSKALPKSGLLMGLLFLGSCGAGQQAGTGPGPSTPVADAISIQAKDANMLLIVGERRFTVTLADNAAARAFAGMLPLTLDMPDLNENEKHAPLPKALPANASLPGMISSGDIMLYGPQTLVVFYKSFPTPYSYTPVGRVDDPSGLAQALGPGSARIEFISYK